MAVKSSQTTLPIFILSCVCFSTHFDEDDYEIFDGSHTGFSVLDYNIFIVDEHNDETCHLDNDVRGFVDDNHMCVSIII